MTTGWIGPVFCGFHTDDWSLWWFRVFGYGISLKDAKRRELLFSDRNGFSGRRIGRFHVTLLRP